MAPTSEPNYDHRYNPYPCEPSGENACKWNPANGLVFDRKLPDGTSCDNETTCGYTPSEIRVPYLNPNSSEACGVYACVIPADSNVLLNGNYFHPPYGEYQPKPETSIFQLPPTDPRFRLLAAYWGSTKLFPFMQENFFPIDSFSKTGWRAVKIYTGRKDMCNAYYTSGEHAIYVGVCYKNGVEFQIELDGGVITHETGHAILNFINPNIGFDFLDIEGGALHEAFADLMKALKTGRPTIGEDIYPFIVDGEPKKDVFLRTVAVFVIKTPQTSEEPHDRSAIYSGYFWGLNSWLGHHNVSPENARKLVARLLWELPAHFRKYPITSDDVVKATLEAAMKLDSLGLFNDLLPAFKTEEDKKRFVTALEWKILQSGVNGGLIDQPYLNEDDEKIDPFEFIQNFMKDFAPPSTAPEETINTTFEAAEEKARLPGNRFLVHHHQIRTVKDGPFKGQKIILEGHGWSELVDQAGKRTGVAASYVTDKEIDYSRNLTAADALKKINPIEIRKIMLARGYKAELVDSILRKIDYERKKDPTLPQKWAKSMEFATKQSKKTVNYKFTVSPLTIYVDAKTGELDIGKTVFGE